MDLFCVSTRSRYRRGKHYREKTNKDKDNDNDNDDDEDEDEKNTSILSTARIEARPRKHLRRINSEKHAKCQSRTMSNLNGNLPQADLPAHIPGCACALCFSQQLRSLSAPGPHHLVGYPSGPPGPGDNRAHENLHHSAPVHRLYVHPYSIVHYQIPVVDRSTTCYGHHPAPFPAYYMAVVPVAATLHDVEGALLHRPGLLAMARLSRSEELRHVRTFLSLEALHEASMQLEIWDENGVGVA
ncbi:hypothetical protein F5X97DRAFT_296775 [Nemania serpens]|nr:hypothetical protein F5X97DRAFT_296775 [Nemania serpens]